MAVKITPSKYKEIKAALKPDATDPSTNGVSKQFGISTETVRRIKRSKSYRSYRAIVDNAHLTHEQRKLISEGKTRQEAIATTTAAKATEGAHEVPSDAKQLLGQPAMTESLDKPEATDTIAEAEPAADDLAKAEVDRRVGNGSLESHPLTYEQPSEASPLENAPAWFYVALVILLVVIFLVFAVIT